MSFLPDNYKEPKKTSKYWNKFEQGESKFRILGAALPVWEWWVDGEDGKRTPKRVMFDKKSEIPNEYAPGNDDGAYFVWKVPVYDYKAQEVRILSIRQTTIRSKIEGTSQNTDYGDPTGYDWTIVKEGEGFDTSYDKSMPSPPKPMSKEVKDALESTPINMQALLTGDDPFNSVDVDQVAKDLDNA